VTKLILTLLIIFLPAWVLLIQPGYFPIHDDLQLMRQLQLEKCFQDHQIPCRWVPDMGYGFGYPLFNFYPPGPYYFGQLFRIFGFQFVDVAKMIGIVGFIASGLSMYLLARQFWGRSGAFISAVLYMYAPYHSVDFYVRAAVNEFYAQIFIPLVFLFLYQIIKTHKWFYTPLLSLSLAGLLLSHNPTLMIFAPFCIAWTLFWLIKFNQNRFIVRPFSLLAVSGIWSLGLSAFFTLPVIFEGKFVHLETLVMGYFNYLAHYADIKQLFLLPNWGYGASVLGPGDEMSMFLGYLHWILPLVIILFARKNRTVYWFLGASLLISLFFTHSKSTILWQMIKPLEFLQFPWRFLTLAIFFSSFLSGAILNLFQHKLIIPLVVTLTLLLNANYFRPRTWYPNMVDTDKFTGDTWRLQRTASIFDYLPKYAPLPPAVPPVGDLHYLEGKGEYIQLAKRSNYQQYQLQVSSPALIELQTLYFPGWKLKLNGQNVSIDPSQDPLLGRPRLTVPVGTHVLEYVLTSTPIQLWGNSLTLISLAALLIVAIKFALKLPQARDRSFQ
jgi:uncharacterized membrane protein